MAKELSRTPLAEARWCQLLGDARPNKFNKPPSWTIELVLDSQNPEHLEWMEQVEAEFPKRHGEQAKKSVHWLPIKPDKEEKVARGKAQRYFVAKFSLNEFTFSDGNKSEGPTVFDSTGHAWDPKSLIGNGSKLVIGYDIWAWPDKGTGAGMTLNVYAAQVKEWIAYEGGQNVTATDFGFDSSPEADEATKSACSTGNCPIPAEPSSLEEPSDDIPF